MKYVLTKISDGSVLEYTDSDNEAGNFPPDVSQKDMRWYPLVKVVKPTIDPATQVAEKNDGVVVNDYVQDWTVRSKTQPELDQDVADLDTLNDLLAIDAVANIFGKIAFDIENRVRALESKSVITATQYKAAVKAAL